MNLLLLLSVLFSGLGLAANDPRPAHSKAITDALQPFVDRHELAGAVVLVADRDRVLSLDAVGYADLRNQRKMEPMDVFWIASQSKPITATALMMLVDEGKVKLDDPVEKYLPEFRGQWLKVEQDADHILLRRPRHPITVREVLSHTSGLPFKSAVEEPTLDLSPLRDAVHGYALTPLQFEPGTKYQYSNAGINTTGRIIEVVSGMPYQDFLQKRLFDPLGMRGTTFWPGREVVSRVAKSYKPNKDGTGLEETTITQLHYPLGNYPHRYPVPAGGLFSTAPDVGRFCRMVLNGGTFEGKRYLSEAAVKEMTSKQTGDLKENYGLGWSTGAAFGHGGAYATNMTIDPKRGLVLVFMVQHAGFPGDGNLSLPAFHRAAREQFGGPGK